MRVIFRTDGNPTLGMGHLMRCLSLAKALQRLDFECMFVVSDDSCISYIQKNGFPTHNLDGKWNDYDSSINLFIPLIQIYNPYLVIIDSYYYSEDFLRLICSLAKVAIITELYPGNIIAEIDYFINYNIYLNNFNQYPNFCKTKYILGSKYALLRKEFETAPTPKKQNQKSIVILTGGSDPYNIASEICNAIINDIRFTNITVNIISGKLNPHIPCLLKLAQASKQVSVSISPSDMRNEMLKSKVAISAGGSTLYELCACSIPAISFTYADNQIDIVECFNNIKVIPYSGDIRVARLETLNCMLKLLHSFLSDSVHLDLIKLKMRELCDGNGSTRVASILSK